MTKFQKLLTIRLATALFLISLPFLGSDCEDIINQNNQTGTLTGDWTLIYNAGTTLDICPGEQVNFPSESGGVATLKCPSQGDITRNYTVSGTTLTYTESGIKYEVAFTQNNELVLSGINNNRILYYSNQISTNTSDNRNEPAKNSASNSSETK
jgi:hypothetical protein